MRRLAKRFNTAVAEKRASVGNAILEAVVEATPVDTSKALSNWQVSPNGAPGSEIEAHFAGSRGSTRGASARQALALGVRSIRAGRLQEGLLIFNAAPYIRRLNDGWSAQAPSGFIEKAVLLARLRSQDQGLNLRGRRRG